MQQVEVNFRLHYVSSLLPKSLSDLLSCAGLEVPMLLEHWESAGFALLGESRVVLEVPIEAMGKTCLKTNPLP